MDKSVLCCVYSFKQGENVCILCSAQVSLNLRARGKSSSRMKGTNYEE